ncbi:hypothetical protein [Maricaulis parjimensis]|uniref:hypothetical protein n=1 Tax=Maricaulis parjimensis TaxID=144023 RepID=UPI00193A1C46|nr:hypothetical protein [Maricaulis parjimensis]
MFQTGEIVRIGTGGNAGRIGRLCKLKPKFSNVMIWLDPENPGVGKVSVLAKTNKLTKVSNPPAGVAPSCG